MLLTRRLISGANFLSTIALNVPATSEFLNFSRSNPVLTGLVFSLLHMNSKGHHHQVIVIPVSAPGSSLSFGH